MTADEAGEEVVEEHCFPGYEQATNNQMELMACIKALELASEHPGIEIVNEVWLYTDSMYVKENVPNAMFGWPKSKWLGRNGRPIENAELWKDLVKAIKRIPHRVRFEWVKGHSKSTHNKAVDKLAKASAQGVLQRALRPVTVRRKTTSQKVQIGSVAMAGQTMSVRIVTDTYLRTQKLYRYLYEVLSKSSPFFGCADYIFSTELLRAGHHYEVRVNNEARNPRILEVFHELDRGTGIALSEE